MQTTNFSSEQVRHNVRTGIRALFACGINLLVFSLVLVIVSSCGTVRQFQVRTIPEGALLLKQDQWLSTKPIETPENEKIRFLSKSEEYKLIAMKRGYLPDTVIVNRESLADVTFRMQRVEGVSTELPAKPDFLRDKALLLPLDVNFKWHKGVGKLDKFETDDELSIKCAEELTRALSGNPVFEPVKPTEKLTSFRALENNALMLRLSKIHPAFLNYYARPVILKDLIEANDWQTISDYLSTSDVKYLMYINCISVRPTAGRIIGNIAVSVASSTMYTIGYLPFYDPSAFYQDNSTLASIYIIDPKTCEVVDIQQVIVSYDIYKSEQIEKLAGQIIASLQKKSNQKQ